MTDGRLRIILTGRDAALATERREQANGPAVILRAYPTAASGFQASSQACTLSAEQTQLRVRKSEGCWKGRGQIRVSC